MAVQRSRRPVYGVARSGVSSRHDAGEPPSVFIAKRGGFSGVRHEEIRKLLDRTAAFPGTLFFSTAPASGIPGLLIHDLKDAVIPYVEAEALANAWPGLKVMTTTGKGHRDILSAPAVLKAIVEFVGGAP